MFETGIHIDSSSWIDYNRKFNRILKGVVEKSESATNLILLRLIKSNYKKKMRCKFMIIDCIDKWKLAKYMMIIIDWFIAFKWLMMNTKNLNE